MPCLFFICSVPVNGQFHVLRRQRLARKIHFPDWRLFAWRIDGYMLNSGALNRNERIDPFILNSFHFSFSARKYLNFFSYLRISPVDRYYIYSLLGTYNCCCYGLETFWQDRLELTQPIDLIEKKDKKKGCGHRCCDVHSFEKIPTVDKANGIAFGFPTLRISFFYSGTKFFFLIFKRGKKKVWHLQPKVPRIWQRHARNIEFSLPFPFLAVARPWTFWTCKNKALRCIDYSSRFRVTFHSRHKRQTTTYYQGEKKTNKKQFATFRMNFTGIERTTLPHQLLFSIC